jgi:RPA family protein
MSQQDIPTREVARRVFAGEFNTATYTFTESDAERAPVYALLPTGAPANRVYFVGTLTETEDVGSDNEYWRGRVVDPTGTFFVYAGQYQPAAAAKLRELEPPAYIAVVGKPRTYTTDDGSVTVSVRPETISVVDAATRDAWVLETARQTIDRMQGEDPELESYREMVSEAYPDPEEDIPAMVVTALESVDGAVTDELPLA